MNVKTIPVLYVCLIMICPLLNTNVLAESTAYKSAVVNNGSYVDCSHMTAKRFDSLLNLLARKYVENDIQIGSITARLVNDMLRPKGINISYLNVMEGLNTIIPPGRFKYGNVLATYTVLRRSGYSHDKAIRVIQQLIDTRQLRKVIDKYY